MQSKNTHTHKLPWAHLTNYNAQGLPSLEAITELPEELSGRWGKNRPASSENCQLNASNDLEAVQAWLNEFANQAQTLRSYRKEVERLLLWCWLELGRPLSSLSREDLSAYQNFLLDPQPASRWCGNTRAARHSADWRPFQQGGLSPASQAHALRVLKGLFQYLHTAGYLAGNPLALVKQKEQRLASRRVRERHLDTATWDALVDYLHNLEPENAQHAKVIERWRFLLAFLYLLAPRAHEVAKARMNDLFERQGGWWWAVEGKGGKYAEIPVHQAFIQALARYRKSLSLTPFPASDDFSHLVLNLAGTQGISANMIYRTMKDLTLAASQAWSASDPDIATRLEKASTHWFRHTSITHQADAGVELRFLARNARHTNLATTRIYLHEEDEAWHAQSQKLNWEG